MASPLLATRTTTLQLFGQFLSPPFGCTDAPANCVALFKQLVTIEEPDPRWSAVFLRAAVVFIETVRKSTVQEFTAVQFYAACSRVDTPTFGFLSWLRIGFMNARDLNCPLELLPWPYWLESHWDSTPCASDNRVKTQAYRVFASFVTSVSEEMERDVLALDQVVSAVSRRVIPTR
jgi:hypothetical protein